MAEIFVDEGLDAILGIVPKNGTNLANTYLGLFKSQTPTTVPARTATGGASPSGWSEVTGTGYARQAIPAASWGAPATNGSGRRTTGPQVTFTATGGPWDAANGFFIATQSASGASDVIIYFANFDTGVARQLQASGDTLKVTPTMQMDG